MQRQHAHLASSSALAPALNSMHLANRTGQSSESPASDLYPQSASSSSRHTSASSLPAPSFTTALSGHHSYADVFEASDREDEGAKFNNSSNQVNSTIFPNLNAPQVNQVQIDSLGPNSTNNMAGAESWYDPESADSYAMAQVFMSGDQAIRTQSQPQQQHHQGLPASMANLAQEFYTHGGEHTSNQSFRDPQQFDGLGPSPFASPATSHHRANSFGSEYSSPPSLFPQQALQSQPQQQQQQQQQQWFHSELGGLQRMQSITLDDGSQQNLSVYPEPPLSSSPLAHNASSTSLHSQISHHSAQQPQSSSLYPDNSLEQLIAQHQEQMNTASPQLAQQPGQSIPNFAVHDTNDNSKLMLGPELTFEQVLQQLSPGVAPTSLNQSGGIMPSPALSQQAMFNANFEGSSDEKPQSSTSPSQWNGAAGTATQTSATPNQPAYQPPSNAASLAPRPPPPHIAVRKPTREDSIDKLKKFLKLDVNMAYTGPEDDSPTTSFMRKRSASDAGPAAANVLNAAEFHKNSIVPENTFDAAKLDFPPEAIDGSAVVMAASGEVAPGWFSTQQQSSQRGATVPQRPISASPAAGASAYARQSAPFGNTGAGSGGVGPMRSGGVASAVREAGAGSPYHQMRAPPGARRPSSSQAAMNVGGQTMGIGASSSSGGSGNSDFLSPVSAANLPSWSFPSARPASPGTVRRAQSTRQGPKPVGSHRRTAQSEDFSRHGELDAMGFRSQFGMTEGMQNPSLQFTANQSAAQAAAFYGNAAEVQSQGQQHQRNYSYSPGTVNEDVPVGGAPQQVQQGQGMSPSAFGGSPAYSQQDLTSPLPPSMAPNSHHGPYAAVGNNGGSPLGGATSPGMSSAASNASSPAAYSQTALPTYASLAPPRRRLASGTSSSSSSGSYSAAALANPPVQNVTTSATQAASASRRKNDAQFVCPVPGCGSHFTRQFNLRSHLRSHADERPFLCPAPGCDKAFARAHDAKRHHETLHLSVKKHICEYCQRQFARLDALHRHLKPENGTCADKAAAAAETAGEDKDSVSSLTNGKNGDDTSRGLATSDPQSRGGGVGGGTSSFAGHVL